MRLILTTVPLDKTEKLKTSILKEKLAACVLELGLLTPSKFLWKGQIDEEHESPFVFKTRKGLKERSKKKIKELHPYDVPFIGEIKIDDVNKEYYDWLCDVTK